MSAVPKITEQPLVRPTFVPVRPLEQFIEANRLALVEWHNALRAAGETWELGDDYRDFCALQYDITCEQEAAKEPRRGLPADDRSFEELMEALVGKPSRGPL